MGNDEHGPAYPEACPDVQDWCERDNCPRRNPEGSTRPLNYSGAFSAGIMVGAVLMLLFLSVSHAFAFDHGFDPYDPTNIWFSQLLRHDKMPDSCCGKADAYVADVYTRNPDGSYDVTITDGDEIIFPDGTTRPGLPNGSVVHVPWNKINPPKETKGNPTGHAWLFVSLLRYADNSVVPGPPVCFAPRPEGS